MGAHAQSGSRPASTASARVQRLDSAFALTPLPRQRRVWIYLPPDYAVTHRRYPVLYMHDGESVFDQATATGRQGPVEWQVDETLDATRQPCIVVAVASDPAHRMQEYNPREEGRAYLTFLVETLKPYIDQHYRTRPGQPYTYLAGSSLGGLITFYAGLYYPQVFGGLGVFSPSFWAVPGVQDDVRQTARPARHRRQRYYVYAGGQEARQAPNGQPVRMAADAQAVATLLRAQSGATVQVVINPDGRHGAQAWQQAFPAFYYWLRHE